MNLAKALWVAGAALLVISAGLLYSGWSWAKHAVRARAVIRLAESHLTDKARAGV